MMKKFWVICLLLYVERADAEYDLLNNDGWIPITNMQTYGTRRSDAVPELHTIQDNIEYLNRNDFIQVVTPDVRSAKEFSSIIENPTDYEKSHKKSYQEIKEGGFNVEDECKDRGASICPDKEEIKSKTFDTNRFDRSLKMPKSFTDINTVRVADDASNTHHKHYENTDITNSESNKILRRKDYEVTEEAESTDTNHGYVYGTPKSITSNNLNLNNKLLNILAKHSIRNDDDLQNYVLSRRYNDRNPTAPELVGPFDFKTRGYNSLNHLPVDPLLAVFLSHYGHYLPSAYGIRSNYSNAYGYLASNNIHNNKPFGMYKMFSDNDSKN